jgi:nucleotide-binding universal stress UspA family protein
VIVPLDGSEQAEQALTHASNLARASGAPIQLVSVVGYPYLETRGMSSWALQREALDQLVREETAQAEQYLARVRDRLAGEGFDVTTEVRRGAVDRAIVADSRPGDVIVMTTHGRGGVARWFLGSVAEAVVRRAPVPVLLIRSQSDQEPSSDQTGVSDAGEVPAKT